MSYSILYKGHCYSVPCEIYRGVCDGSINNSDFELLLETSDEIIEIY